GAGIITGVELITLPARHQLPIVQYAQFIRVHYRGKGVPVYAVVTVIGSLMTFVLSIAAFLQNRSAAERSCLVLSVLATTFGFLGTGVAFPAIIRLWQAPDDDEVLLAELLDRFARWGLLSTVSHVVAFAALIVALMLAGRSG